MNKGAGIPVVATCPGRPDITVGYIYRHGNGFRGETVRQGNTVAIQLVALALRNTTEEVFQDFEKKNLQ